MNDVELLMPAGNMEKLEYAVKYGADAVYLGVVDFSLRAMRKGEIITLDNLKSAIDLAHKLRAKAYLTLNIFAFNDFLGPPFYVVFFCVISYNYFYFAIKNCFNTTIYKATEIISNINKEFRIPN